MARSLIRSSFKLLSGCSARNITNASKKFTQNQNLQFESLIFNKSQTISGVVDKRCFSSSNSSLSAVKVQHPAPDFKGQAVVNGQFKEIKLSDYKGKYLVLFFYPLDFTFVCPTEIVSFSENMDKFRALKTEVVGVSTDSHFSHLAWINTPRKDGGLGGLDYPLLSDFNKNISRDYGVLLENEGVALRGLFLIDPTGTVRQITINDLPVGRSVDEVLRLIEAFQFVEVSGEVCPANWNKNAKSMKPDPVGSKEYFGTVYNK